MKISKFLLSLLLTLPIFILAIVLYSSTIIGFIVPRPISDIKASLDNFDYQKNLQVNFAKTNLEKNIFLQIYPFKARSNKIEVYNLNTDICELGNINFDENGLAKVTLKSLNYGFSEITIKTVDGNYKTTIDVNVLDKNKDPNEFLGVTMEYKEELDNHLIFGNKNHLDVKFKYYPKTARNNINEQLSFSSNLNIVKIKDNFDGTGVVTLDMAEGINFLSIKANSTGKIVKYNFNTKTGYNYQLNTVKELNDLLNGGNNVFLLNNLISNEKIKIKNNSNINGNNFKISFKEDYKENIGVEVKGAAVLENLNIEGPLVEKNHQILPLENFIGLYLENNTTDKIIVKKLKVENGKYNIYVKGKSSFDKKWNPANFIISETELIGSLYSGILVDSSEEISLFVNSTNLDLNDIKFKYCSVGILIKNSGSNISGQSKGYSVININKSQTNKKYSIDIFDNWTNVEQSSGIIGKDIFSLLSKEMKNYPDVIYKKNDFSYVNCLIVKYGGIVNKSIVNIEQETNNFLVKKIKKPSISESFLPIVGGTYQFEVYFLLNQFYEYKGE